jgi:hypothetical protein
MEERFMHWLAPYALPGIIAVSGLGALIMCALAFKYGLAVDLDEDSPRRVGRALPVTRIGHVVAGLCFASASILAVVSLQREAAPTVGAAPTVAEPPVRGGSPGGDLASSAEGDRALEILVRQISGETDHLSDELRQLREQLTRELGELDARVRAAESLTSKTGKRDHDESGEPKQAAAATDDSSSGSEVAQAKPDAGSRQTAARARGRDRTRSVAPEPAVAGEASRGLETATPSERSGAGAIGAPPATAERAPGSGPVGRPSRSRARRAPASTGFPVTASSAAGQASQLSATVAGLRVELGSQPAIARAGEETSYTLRLVDSRRRPLTRAEVTLHGNMADGTPVSFPLDATSQPGIYRGKVQLTDAGPRDLRLRVVRRDRRFELPLTQMAR